MSCIKKISRSKATYNDCNYNDNFVYIFPHKTSPIVHNGDERSSLMLTQHGECHLPVISHSSIDVKLGPILVGVRSLRAPLNSYRPPQAGQPPVNCSVTICLFLLGVLELGETS